jgi:hypothetical protein
LPNFHVEENDLKKLFWLLASLVLATGCTHYVTPGGPVHFEDINRTDIADVISRKPSPHFPANVAIVRVQAPQYRSYSADGYGTGRYSVVTTQELLTDDAVQDFSKWTGVAGVAPVSRLLLPSKLESLDDLRVAAAKVQADVLLAYTIDTTFRVRGNNAFGPLSVISLGLVPDRDAYVTSTASAIFTDVRTGYTYGVAEATAKASGLTNAWGSSDTIDKKRLEAEGQAFALLLAEARKTWDGITKRYE